MVMSGPIPEGSPVVSARGFVMRQRRLLLLGCSLLLAFSRYSIIAAARMSFRYAFDFASNFAANILSRISFFFGVSTLVGFLAHSATISTPCFVTSGGVR